MLAWFAETTLISAVLAAAATLVGRRARLGPAARHAFWLVVLVKLVAPPVVTWPRPACLAWPAPVAAEPPTRPAVAATGGPVTGPSVERPSGTRRTTSPKGMPGLAAIGRGTLAAWAAASAALALWQVGRIARFRRRLRWGVPAPDWLAEEARAIGRSMGVPVPEILVLPDATTPMLWALGRPRLLVPARLVGTIGAAGWRGILAHELAHIRRRDHWVRRLELAAGLLWWWSPLYWLTRRRLEAEAELACDAMAIRAVPGGRLAFAEALLEVCRSLPSAGPPAPALGVAGAGRFLERRVTMILRDQAPSRAPATVLLGAFLLAILALPGWTVSAASASAWDPGPGEPSFPPQSPRPKPTPVVADADIEIEVDVDVDVDDEDDDEDSKPAKPKEAKLLAAKLKEAKALKGKLMEKEGQDSDKAKDAEKLAKELEAKFGPGSDFEKQMKKQFGPGSDFEKQMKEIGKQFGPGSDFEKQMKKIEAEAKVGLEKKIEASADLKKKLNAEAAAGLKRKPETKVTADDLKKLLGAEATADDLKKLLAAKAAASAKKPKDEQPSRQRRIRELRALIEKLSDELDALEDEDDDDR